MASLTARKHERHAWANIALGAAMMLAGDFSRGFSHAPLRPPLGSAGTLSGLLWLGAYLPYVLALSLFIRADRVRGVERVRQGVELLVLVLLIGLVLFTAVLYPLYGSGESPGSSLLPTLLSFLSLAVSFSLLIFVISRRPKLHMWHQPLVAALVIVAVGSAFSPLVQSATAFAVVADFGEGLPWFLGYTFVAISGLERVSVRHSVPKNVSVEIGPAASTQGTVVSAAVFLLLPLFVYVDSKWVGEPLGDNAYSLLITAGALAVIARNIMIAVENGALRRTSTTDPLTGLLNHRQFLHVLDVEIERATRTDRPIALIAMDVDEFDRVNNVYGHAAGDRRLRSIADKLGAHARETDAVCRIGGDEFAIIMPDTDPVEALKVCLRLQDQLHEADGVCPLPATVSMGIAGLPKHATTREDLIERADGALYWAKFHGREQAIIYDSGLVGLLDPDERLARLEEDAYLNTVQVLSSAVDARDEYTHSHSRRVAALCTRLAREVGLSPREIDQVQTAALLHDVGKIGVPDSVLHKNGPLDDEELELIREHPLLAARILGAIPHNEIVPWIAAHHERWDGCGYPAGLAGDAIPMQSRIIAICDAFDAMTSDRLYRNRLTLTEALDEITACAGTQFDPEFSSVFVALVGDLDAQGVRV